MTVHPSLQNYADAWTHSIEAIAELVQPLVEGEWNRPTPCIGWSVRDIVSHVIGMETEMLGDPRPIHSLPRDLYHVRSDFARYMEVQVDVRRHHTAPEMTSELEYILIRRARQLRNENRSPEHLIRAPSAPSSPWNWPTGCAPSTCGCTSRTCGPRSVCRATWTRRART